MPGPQRPVHSSPRNADVAAPRCTKQIMHLCHTLDYRPTGHSVNQCRALSPQRLETPCVMMAAFRENIYGSLMNTPRDCLGPYSEHAS